MTPNNNSITSNSTESSEDRDQIKRIVWRDFISLLLAIATSTCISFIEVNAGDASLRGGEADERGTVDTGFIVTSSFAYVVGESPRNE